MFKGLSGWFIRRIASVVLISSLTVFVAWNMMELYMSRMLAQIDSEMDSEVELGELLAQMTGLNNKNQAERSDLSAMERITQSTRAELKDPLKEKDAESDTAGEMEGIDGTDDTHAVDDNDAMKDTHAADETGLADAQLKEGHEGQEELEEDNTPSDQDADHGILDEAAVPVFGQGGAESDGDRFVMSAEEFLSWQEKMTDEDKMAVFAILLGKIPQEDFQSLSLWLEDGLTAGEISEIYRLMDKHLSTEEMTELGNILKKYE